MSADTGGLDDRGLSSPEAAEIVAGAVRAHADQAVDTADSTAALISDTPLPDACRHVDTNAQYAGYDTEPAARIVLLADVMGIDNNLALRRRLQGDPWLLGQLGLDAIPSATTLWRIRTKRFEDVFYTELRAAARTVARRCREHGLDADGPPEQSRPDAGDGRLGSASQTVAQADRLTDAASREVYPELSLDRDDNTAIPDTGFWELASFLSTQADSHANAGAQRYLTESRQTTPLGDNFRAQLSALSVDEQRAQLQSAAANLVREARAEGHLDREVPVAVDTTTGPRFWGDRADHEDTILGTKAPDGQYAYHYATLQIVDEDDQEDSDDEQATYYLWKTNVSLPEDDEAALNRVKRLYAKRWRIESAYQSLKQFLIPTTSKSQELRFWYFSFASLLYSVWRLVNVILRERVGGDEERPVVPAEMVVSFVRRATGTG